MPIIPETPTPRVGRQAVSAGLPDTGATIVGRGLVALGQGLQRATDAGLEGADAFAQLQDETEADKRTLEALKFRTQLIAHPGDAKSGIQPGYLNRVGEAAQGSTTQFQEAMDKRIEELEKGLSPRARQIFRANIYPDYLNGFQTVARHESASMMEARAALSGGIAQEYARSISSNFKSAPEEVTEGLKMIETKMREAAEGFSGENIPDDPAAKQRFEAALAFNIQAEQEKALMSRAAIALENKDIESARAVLEQFGDRLSDDSKEKIKGAIGGAYLASAAVNAAKIVIGAPGASEMSTRAAKDTAVALASRAMASVGYEMTPDWVEHVETLTEQELRDRQADVDRQKTRASEIPRIRIQTAIQQNALGESNPGYLDATQVGDVYREARAEAVRIGDATAVSQIDEAYNAFRANPNLGGFAAIDNPSAKAGVNGMTNDQLRALSDADVNAYKPQLTQATWNDLVDRRRKAKNARPTDTPVLERAQIQEIVMGSMYQSNLISTQKVKSLSGEQLDSVNRMMDLVMIDAGPNPTRESVAKATSKLLVDEFSRVGFFGTESDVSPAEVIADPSIARRIPGFMEEMRKLGYDDDQLENDFILSTAVQQVMTNRARKKRARQLNQGPVKP